jgi:hypothetical protein
LARYINEQVAPDLEGLVGAAGDVVVLVRLETTTALGDVRAFGLQVVV